MSTARPIRLDRTSLARAAAHLASRDEQLRGIFRRHGPPPLWSRRPGFSTLVRIILEQQVSLASARAVFLRLSARVSPLTARRLAALSPRDLRAIGLTRQKADYCLTAARAVASGRLDLHALARMDDDEARDTLMQIRGIGPWTADIYLLMALGRADVWPRGDRALIVALEQVKGPAACRAAGRHGEIADGWRPFRSVAARMLWKHYLAGSG